MDPTNEQSMDIDSEGIADAPHIETKPIWGVVSSVQKGNDPRQRPTPIETEPSASSSSVTADEKSKYDALVHLVTGEANEDEMKNFDDAFLKIRADARMATLAARKQRAAENVDRIKESLKEKQARYAEENEAMEEEDQVETNDDLISGASSPSSSSTPSSSAVTTSSSKTSLSSLPDSETQVKFSVVCSSNNNRSMAAHKLMKEKNFDVSSAGTGTNVRLPGPTQDRPNIFDFGTPYEEMYRTLQLQNEKLYMRNGILPMLHRNANIKTAPERWIDSRPVDVVICCEERCFESVQNDFMSRPVQFNIPVHLINVEIKDDVETAKRAGHAILMLAELITQSPSYDQQMTQIIRKVRQKYNNPIMHAVVYY